MKRKEILFFVMAPDVDTYLNQFETFINEVCNNFKNVYLVCCDNLVERKKIKKYNNKQFSNLFKKIKIFIPNDFNSLNIFLKNKNPIIINNFGRVFKYYRLLFYLKRINIPQISINHVGNVQGGAGYIGYTSKFPINLYLQKILQQKISTILSILGIFPKVDIRFSSNRLIYNAFIKNKKRFVKLPSIYKEFILVRSKQFDTKFFNTKKKLSEKYILLLNRNVDGYEFLRDLPHKLKDASGKVSQNFIDEHYKNLINLLDKLSKIFKKKIIISIKPGDNLNKTIQRFQGRYQVVKFRTKELIKKSFLVINFSSSAVIDAVALKKKIIALQSELFKDKKYCADLYIELLNLKAINIYKKININGKHLIKDLNSRLKYYDKYLKRYTASDLKVSGNKEIIRIIKSRYF